jgi:hypothetical protein
MECGEDVTESTEALSFIPWFESGFCFLPPTSQFAEFVQDTLALQNEPLKTRVWGLKVLQNETLLLGGQSIKGRKYI